MNHKKMLMFAVCLLLACSSWLPVRADNEMTLGILRDVSGFTTEIYGTVSGLTAARMLKDGDVDWVNFDIFDDTFELTGIFADLNALNSAIPGTYTVEFTHTQGTTQYIMTLATVQESWFPDIPVLDPIPAQIPQLHTFSWTWDGVAAMKGLDAWGDDGHGFDQYVQWFSSDPGFADLAYSVNFGNYLGEAFFEVLYANMTEDLLSSWSLDSGDDLFDGQNPMAVSGSGDGGSFVVIPEPATALLLVAGALGLLRRRR